MSDGADMNKAQRLALAAAVAPVLRAQTLSGDRRVSCTDADGKTVRHVTVRSIQIGLLRRMAIELDMGTKRRAPKHMATLRKAIEMCAAWPGSTIDSIQQALITAGFVVTRGEVARLRPRPTHVLCELCGKPVEWKLGRGRAPRSCRGKGGCDGQKVCAHEGCGRAPREGAFEPALVRARKGQPWRCYEHGQTVEDRRKNGHLTAERHSKGACPKGHPYSPENTAIVNSHKGQYRSCKECRRVQARDRYAAVKRAGVLA